MQDFELRLRLRIPHPCSSVIRSGQNAGFIGVESCSSHTSAVTNEQREFAATLHRLKQRKLRCCQIRTLGAASLVRERLQGQQYFRNRIAAAGLFGGKFG